VRFRQHPFIALASMLRLKLGPYDRHLASPRRQTLLTRGFLPLDGIIPNFFLVYFPFFLFDKEECSSILSFFVPSRVLAMSFPSPNTYQHLFPPVSLAADYAPLPLSSLSLKYCPERSDMSPHPPFYTFKFILCMLPS